LKKDADL